MLRRVAAPVLGALLLLDSQAASAQSCNSVLGNLVQNCSFELGVVNNGADYPNAIVSNWTPLGGPQGGTFERWTNGFDGFWAKDGNSHIELQVNGPTRIQQVLNTSAGQSYSLNFWAAHRPRDVAGFSQLDVYLNGSFFTSTGQITTPYSWQQTSSSFLATGQTTLEFRAMGNQLSYGDFLDNVSVAAQANVDSVVPEPSSVALMGLGVAMVGAFARRRRTN